VLTITLNDGSTVSGRVVNGTKIECPAAGSSMATAADHGGGDGSGDGGSATGSDGGSQSGDQHQSSDGGEGSDGEDSGDGHGGDGEDENHPSNCGPSALTPGAIVHDATLEVGQAGSEFLKVELAG